MKTGILRRALVTTLVYVAVFLGIVILQFSSPPGFSWRSGIASLDAAHSRADPDRPESIRILLGGLRIIVDAGHPASAVAVDGSLRALSLAGVSKDGGGVAVGFSGGASLTLRSRGTGTEQELFLSATFADPRLKSLRLSYELPQGSTLAPGPASVLLSSARASSTLALGPASFRNGLVTVDEEAPLVAKVKAAAAKSKPIPVAKNDVEFRQVILAWMDRAWSGLSGSRLDAASLTWRGPGPERSFSEPALVAWLAEAFRRGLGGTVITTGRLAREKHGAELGWLSVPYMGNTIELMSKREASDAAEARRLVSLVKSGDPSILEVPNLVLRLVDRSPRGFYPEAMRFIAGLAPADLSTRQLVGLAAVAVDAGLYIRGSVDPLSNRLAAELRLSSAIVRAGPGYYLEATPDGKVDLALQVDAGLALIGLGKTEAKDELLASGQALVESALALADEEGFVPATLALKAGAIEARNGLIAPETLYARLANNPYYPHEVSFARDVEPGVWAWTCAPTLTIEGSASRRSFSATFPVGIAHYMAIYGVRSFSNIRLYGIDYSPDAQFESYNVSGYLYRAASASLYLKMRHKSEVERIELAF